MSIQIDPGETTTIIGPSDPRGKYSLSVEDENVRVHSVRGQVRDGEKLRPGEEGELEVHRSDGRIFAHNPTENANTAVMSVRKTNFSLIKRSTTVVSGGGGHPIQTTTTGTVQTDNYDYGDAFDYDGSAYPYTIDPAATIQELVITDAGGIDAEITTEQGDTFTLPLAATVGSWEGWEIDIVTFRDPAGTTARIAGGWAGE